MTDTGVAYYRALFDELRRLGYIEGQNLEVERYSGGGRVERYAELAQAVVRSHPDLIFTQTTRLVRIFKNATTTIPVVAYLSDPVAYGLVTSLARPGGNITGVVADPGIQIQGKYVEVLRETLGGRLSRLRISSPASLGSAWANSNRHAGSGREDRGSGFWRPTRKF